MFKPELDLFFCTDPVSNQVLHLQHRRLQGLHHRDHHSTGIYIIIVMYQDLFQPSRGGLEVEHSLHKRRDSALVGLNPI